MDDPMRILIAQDGAAEEEPGVADLKRAGLPPHAEVVVLSVADVLPLPELPADLAPDDPARRVREPVQRALEDAQRSAAQVRHRIRTTFPEWDLHAEVRADSPAWAIIKKADEWHPSLIVVGSHKRSAVGRFMLGSVSHKVLTEARCSVRIARQTTIERDQAPRLLLGFDGSPDATAVIQAVSQRCWPARTLAYVISVLDPMLISVTQAQRPGVGDVRTALETSMAAAVAPLQRAGLEVSHAILDGDPKRVLVDEANRWEADCLFVGARGLRAVERFLLGSVSAAVAARAHCSVEVVRPA